MRGMLEASQVTGSSPMIDLLYIGLVAAFFILCGIYASGCETL